MRRKWLYTKAGAALSMAHVTRLGVLPSGSMASPSWVVVASVSGVPDEVVQEFSSEKDAQRYLLDLTMPPRPAQREPSRAPCPVHDFPSGFCVGPCPNQLAAQDAQDGPADPNRGVSRMVNRKERSRADD